ncbi:MAG TPA: glycosyl transferase family 2 [Erysipelotrichaceae bacterium]|nr:glycosyl transferase family 2 [Erysipelotrichaceae bacterium]
MVSNKVIGVPEYEFYEFEDKVSEYCLLIPIINEGNRIHKELLRANNANISKLVDIIICDGDSTDNSTNHELLKSLNVNTLLVKKDIGKQGTQLRMGIHFAFKRNYKGILTIDGNNKDSIEDIPLFIDKLKEGYDFVQGSRYIKGGEAINTPLVRHFSVRYIHAPIISLSARHWFTDTTNAFRAYSSAYLSNPLVKPLREVFVTYELLAYLSTRASQLGLKVCEIPVKREYPKNEEIPTKIKGIKGNLLLMSILFKNLLHHYHPKESENV